MLHRLDQYALGETPSRDKQSFATTKVDDVKLRFVLRSTLRDNPSNSPLGTQSNSLSENQIPSSSSTTTASMFQSQIPTSSNATPSTSTPRSKRPPGLPHPHEQPAPKRSKNSAHDTSLLAAIHSPVPSDGINIKFDPALLDGYQTLLEEQVPNDGPVPSVFDTVLAIDALYIRNRPDENESKVYRHIEATHLLLLEELLTTHRGDPAPSRHIPLHRVSARFQRYTFPAMSGMTDYIIQYTRNGESRVADLAWEIKRVLAWLGIMFYLLVKAAAAPDGIWLSLVNDKPSIRWPAQVEDLLRTLDQHDRKAVNAGLKQIFMIFNAHGVSRTLFSTLDHGVLLYRVSPRKIHVSPIVARDPDRLTEELSIDEPQQHIAGSWRPTKLLLALLLSSGNDRFTGWRSDQIYELPKELRGAGDNDDGNGRGGGSGGSGDNLQGNTGGPNNNNDNDAGGGNQSHHLRDDENGHGRQNFPGDSMDEDGNGTHSTPGKHGMYGMCGLVQGPSNTPWSPAGHSSDLSASASQPSAFPSLKPAAVTHFESASHRAYLSHSADSILDDGTLFPLEPTPSLSVSSSTSRAPGDSSIPKYNDLELDLGQIGQDDPVISRLIARGFNRRGAGWKMLSSDALANSTTLIASAPSSAVFKVEDAQSTSGPPVPPAPTSPFTLPRPAAFTEGRPQRVRRSMPPYRLVLGALVGAGRLYRTYTCTLQSFPTFGDDVSFQGVVKIADMARFPAIRRTTPIDGDRYTTVVHHSEAWTYTQAEAANAVQNELDLYSGPLKRLRDEHGGYVVPALRCVFKNGNVLDGEVALIIMEDAGRNRPEEAWTRAERSQILKMYSMLHRQSILHNDVRSRHVLFKTQLPHTYSDDCGDGSCVSIKLIDFEAARTVSPGSEELDAEMSQVRKMCRIQMAAGEGGQLGLLEVDVGEEEE